MMCWTNEFRPRTFRLLYDSLACSLLVFKLLYQNGSADTSNFDEEFTKEQPTLTPVHGQLSSRDQAEFNGFSWVSSFPLSSFGSYKTRPVQVASWADMWVMYPSSYTLEVFCPVLEYWISVDGSRGAFLLCNCSVGSRIIVGFSSNNLACKTSFVMSRALEWSMIDDWCPTSCDANLHAQRTFPMRHLFYHTITYVFSCTATM